MTIDHTGLAILGTIKHRDSIDPGRVTLYDGGDGMIWAAGLGEEPYFTDTEVRHLASWCGPEWDFWPGSSLRCYSCGMVVEAVPDDRGCGCHCPECSATL